MNPFTRVANSLWDNGPLYSLSRAELVLLLHLFRMTAGFHRDCYIASESQMVAETQLSRASLYRAKQRLVEDRLLEVVVIDGVCSYRLTSSMQPDRDDQELKKPGRSRSNGGGLKNDTGLKTETGGGLKNETVTVSKLRLNPSQNWDGPYIKDHVKENFKETSSSTVAPRGDDDDVFDKSLSPKNDDPNSNPGASNGVPVRPDGGEKVPPAPAADPEVVRQLVAWQVTPDVAARLARDCAPELIAAGLRDVEAHNPTNAAGWIVRYCERGGYEAPKPIVAQKRRAAVTAARQTEREQERTRREQAAVAAESQWSAVEAHWSAEYAEELYHAARDKMRGLSRKAAAVPRDSPIMVAAMRDEHLLRQEALKEPK